MGRRRREQSSAEVREAPLAVRRFEELQRQIVGRMNWEKDLDTARELVDKLQEAWQRRGWDIPGLTCCVLYDVGPEYFLPLCRVERLMAGYSIFVDAASSGKEYDIIGLLPRERGCFWVVVSVISGDHFTITEPKYVHPEWVLQKLHSARYGKEKHYQQPFPTIADFIRSMETLLRFLKGRDMPVSASASAPATT